MKMASFSNTTVMVTVKRDELLKRLRQNREKHQSVVKEAREGYVTKAKKLLADRMDKLASGKIVSLSFELQLPVSYVGSYDRAITAFEMHTGETIELSVDDVNHYIADAWSWKSSFITSNAVYSKLAADMSDQQPNDDE
jgi:hypothetical protein